MEAQNNSNLTQNPAQIWIGIGVVGSVGAILLVVKFPIIFWFALTSGVAGLLVWHISERQRLVREAKARASGYMNICGPVVIGSTEPNETVQQVMDRVADFKEQLHLSGNPYADQIPVIAFPYAPMMYEVGSLTLAWNIYQRQVGERQHHENMGWLNRCPAHLKPLFVSQVMGLMEADKLEAA